MRTVRKRTCTGLALTAAYWSEPADELDDDPERAAQLAAMLNVRCAHPGYLPGRAGAAGDRPRRRVRRPAG
jgi:hypothetical protein